MTRLIMAMMILGLVGCGEDDKPTNAGPNSKDALIDLAELLKGATKQKKKPPASMKQLQTLEPVHPGAYFGAVNKEIVYVWGTGIKASGTDIIAYETAAETSGGWVLIQDGTVKEMTADEFKAAAIAK